MDISNREFCVHGIVVHLRLGLFANTNACICEHVWYALAVFGRIVCMVWERGCIAWHWVHLSTRLLVRTLAQGL